MMSRKNLDPKKTGERPKTVVPEILKAAATLAQKAVSRNRIDRDDFEERFACLFRQESREGMSQEELQRAYTDYIAVFDIYRPVEIYEDGVLVQTVNAILPARARTLPSGTTTQTTLARYYSGSNIGRPDVTANCEIAFQKLVMENCTPKKEDIEREITRRRRANGQSEGAQGSDSSDWEPIVD
jgi:hypothetical protein